MIKLKQQLFFKGAIWQRVDAQQRKRHSSERLLGKAHSRCIKKERILKPESENVILFVCFAFIVA